MRTIASSKPRPGEDVADGGGGVVHAVEPRVLRAGSRGRRCGCTTPANGSAGAAQHLEQAGLAGAVAADQADLVAGADREAGALEDDGAAHLDGELADLQHPDHAHRRTARRSEPVARLGRFWRVPAAPADPRARLFVVAAAMLWGTTGTAQALGPDGASSVAVGAARNVVGALVLRRGRRGRGRLLRTAPATSTGGRCSSPPSPPPPTSCASSAACGWPAWPSARWSAWAPGRCGAACSAGSGGASGPGGRWAVATALALAGAALLATTTSDGDPVDPLGIVLALGAGLSYAAVRAVVEGPHRPTTTPTW